MTNANGFTNGGILKLSLYTKLNILKAHTTPNIAASSIKCCSDKCFLGSNSKINTWLTPDDLHPYTLMPIKNINSTKRKGPLYNLKAVLKLSVPPSWNSAGIINIFTVINFDIKNFLNDNNWLLLRKPYFSLLDYYF